jgi:glycosyltransferase involved in cell wall biosynthesis
MALPRPRNKPPSANLARRLRFAAGDELGPGQSRPSAEGGIAYGTRPVKVCFLAPELLPNRGGVGSYSIGLIRELSRRVEVVVVAPRRWEGPETYGAGEIEAYFDHRVKARVISEARDSFVYNARFQLALVREFPALERAERFDLVHAQHAHMPDLLSGALHPKPPTVRTVHSTIEGQREGIREADRQGGDRDPVDQWQVTLGPLLAAAERFVLGRDGDQYIAVSSWTRDQLLERGIAPDRIRVAHCGVDPTIFRPDFRDPELLTTRATGHVVLFPSRLTLIRGAAVMAQAIPSVLAAVPDTIFVITGRKMDDFERVLPLPPGARDHVRFLGHQPYDRLPAVYASSDVVVVPTFYDNFPIRVLEGLASGVPVVASRVGGIPEVVLPETTGLLVPPGSPPALAEALIRLLRDPDLRGRLGRQGRALIAERFTWQHAAERTLEAYRVVAGGG